MKIISKFKDFYDYLTGVYGVDPKLVLDRRNMLNYELGIDTKYLLKIGTHVIDIFVDNIGNIHYGDNLCSCPDFIMGTIELPVSFVINVSPFCNFSNL